MTAILANACFLWEDDALMINLHIQPKAAKNEICGIYNNRTEVSLLAGAASREKRIKVQFPLILPALFLQSPAINK